MRTSLDREIARQLAEAQGPKSTVSSPDDLDAEIARQLDDERRRHGIYQGAVAPPEPSPLQTGLKAVGEAVDQTFGPGMTHAAKTGLSLLAAPKSAAQHPLATAANVAAGVPGVEAAEARARSLVRGQTYADALKDIRAAESSIPPNVRTAERVAGGTLAGAALLPAAASPAVQGALFSGANTLLSADPSSVKARLLRTTRDAAIGAGVGKVAEGVVTAGRIKGAPEFDANKIARVEARTEAARPAYESFRKLGDLGSTPKLAAILDLPVIRRAVETVQGESPTLAQLPATDARVLDAVYKRVGNKAFSAAHGYETDEARIALADAIDDAAKAKGGSYAEALAAYREPSKEIAALDLGRAVQRNATRGAGTAPKKVTTESPTAVMEQVATMAPSEQNALKEGILGQAKRNPLLARAGFTRLPLPVPSKSLGTTADLLREMESPATSTGRRAVISAFLASLLGQ